MNEAILDFKDNKYYQKFSRILAISNAVIALFVYFLYFGCYETFFNSRAFDYINNNPGYITSAFSNQAGLISFLHYFFIILLSSYVILSWINFFFSFYEKTRKYLYIVSCVSLASLILTQLIEAILLWSINSNINSNVNITSAFYRFILESPLVGLSGILLIVYIFLPYFYASINETGKKKYIFTSLFYMFTLLILAGLMSLYFSSYINCLINGAYDLNSSVFDVTLMSIILLFAIFSLIGSIILLIKPLKIKMLIIIPLTLVVYVLLISFIYSSNNELVSNILIRICTYVSFFLAPLTLIVVVCYVNFRNERSDEKYKKYIQDK